MSGMFSAVTFASPDGDWFFAPPPANVGVGSDWTPFFEGEWPDVRVGMQDWAGNVMIPPIFREIRNFENGFAIVADGEQWDLQWGMINTTGYLVVGLGEFYARDLFAIQRLLSLPDDVVLPSNVEALHWHDVRRLMQSRQYIEIFDIGTGITYTVRSFAHGNHADVETINAWETQVHLETFGGFQTWSGRPVWATFNGRTFAAAIHSRQHDVSTIQNNNMDGHICLHFYGSTNNFTDVPFYEDVIAQSIRYAEFLELAAWLRSMPAPGTVAQYYVPYQPAYYSSSSPRIRVGGEFVYIPGDDQHPIIIDGRTLVPLRAVMERLGFYVYWDGVTQMVSLTMGNYDITVQIDNNNMLVNGATVVLEVAPQIMNGRTMVPVRAILEATGMVADWDSENWIVDIRL